MTLRAIILVIFALGAAASTALFARNWVAAQRVQPATAAVQKQAPATAVLVAASDLSAGVFLREKQGCIRGDAGSKFLYVGEF